MRPLAVAALAALALSACQEPAGVGLGLIDEEQSDPRVRTLPLTGLDTLQTPALAQGIADPSASSGQSRILAGAVVDPEFGDATAVAYLDFIQDGDLDDERTGADVREAWLELDPSYVYGDTTTSLPLELRPVLGSWDVESAYPADTLLSVGDVLSTTEVTASDSLRRFDIPEAFVRANADALVGDGFTDAFEGFALQVPASFAPAPGAVLGFGTFETAGAGLRVVVADDTLRYPVSEVFTSVDTRPPAAAPATFVPVRSSQASLRFTVDIASVGTTPVASARLYLPADRSLFEVGSFVRPAPSRMFLFGVRLDDDGDEVRSPRLAEVVLTDDLVGVIADPQQFTQVVQAIILEAGDLDYDFYEVRFSEAPQNPGPVSLDVFPVLRPVEDGAEPPRITLTLVGESL